MQVISYGGGVQSTALLVLACQRELKATHALFANVGDDSEHPDTLRYVREIATPWAATYGVAVVELTHATSLHDRMTAPGSKSIPIPVRMSETGMPGRRACTADYKVKPIRRWVEAHGATADAPADIAIGYSWDEVERVSDREASALERRIYPLVDRRLTREDCKRLIERAGLPVPPKSACWFCPFKRPRVWQDMRRDEPLLFWRAVGVEAHLNQGRLARQQDPVYLTRFGKPLADAIPKDTQVPMDFEAGSETCDEGYCWT